MCRDVDGHRKGETWKEQKCRRGGEGAKSKQERKSRRNIRNTNVGGKTKIQKDVKARCEAGEGQEI